MKLLILFLALASTLHAQGEWLDFRGPDHNGKVANVLPKVWNEEQNVAWKTKLHDHGISTPVILDDRVVLTAASEDGSKSYFLILDLKTGAVLHDIEIFTSEDVEPLGGFGINTYATPSPVSDGKYVYLHYGTYGTACIDPETAEVVWLRRDINCLHFRGPASSPILYKDLLILTMDGIDHQYVTALNKDTGKTIWKTGRTTDFNDLLDGFPKKEGDERKGFNTPLVIKVDGKDQLISVGAKSCFSYDPSTGVEIWHVEFPTHSAAARPFFDGEKVYVSTGYGKADLLAIRPDGEGDVTETHVAWIYKKNVPRRASFLAIDDRLYMVDDGGVATCLNTENGEMIWREGLGGNHSSSLLYSNGLIYAFNEFGEGRLFKAGDTFEVVQENKLDVGMLSSPAVVDDSLILRTREYLYRIDG
jgi:outer membrane protein assembly factor BamB